MRTVNIAELQDQLSAYLQYVRNGEEIVVNDQDTPVARISPIRPRTITQEEAELAAAGVLTLPQETMDWDELFCEPGEEVSSEAIADAVQWSRGRW